MHTALVARIACRAFSLGCFVEEGRGPFVVEVSPGVVVRARVARGKADVIRMTGAQSDELLCALRDKWHSQKSSESRRITGLGDLLRTPARHSRDFGGPCRLTRATLPLTPAVRPCPTCLRRARCAPLGSSHKDVPS